MTLDTESARTPGSSASAAVQLPSSGTGGKSPPFAGINRQTAAAPNTCYGTVTILDIPTWVTVDVKCCF